MKTPTWALSAKAVTTELTGFLRVFSVGVTNRMLPRLHALLPRLKNVINEQPGPAPEVRRERRRRPGKDFKVMIEPQNYRRA